jgi:hypothetical protein
VARNLRNYFPVKLLARWKPENNSVNTGTPLDQNGDLPGRMNVEEATSIHSVEEDYSDGDEMFPEVYIPLKLAIRKACKLVDKELKLHPTIDCFCSGSTAVTLVKQVKYYNFLLYQILIHYGIVELPGVLFCA